MNGFLRYVDEHRDLFIQRLQTLIRQPSVSTEDLGVKETAELVRQYLTEVGVQARLVPWKGYPVVYGELNRKSTGPAKTMSFYNHYDVQPVDPLDLWVSDPFSAEIRDGRMWGRGTADNKGNLMARICAVDAYRQVYGELPLNIKFIAEGEEEIGSPNLESFAEEHQDLIAADACVWEGGFKDATGRLIVYCGVKGILYVELRARAAKDDMHSMWASIVPNPIWRLNWALSTLKDANDHVQIGGFYDSVRPVNAYDEKVLTGIPFDTEERAKDLGITHFVQKLTGMDLLKKHIFQPTCNICGISGGYTAPGMKTVLPKEGMVKIDFRLVPDQSPHEVFEQMRRHLDAHGFKDIEMHLLAAEMPARTDLSDPFVAAVTRAARDTYNIDPIIYPMVPGTGPMHALCQKFGIPSTAAPGVSHPDALIHAPNENIYVEDYIQAIKGIGRLISYYAEEKGDAR